MVYNTNMNGSFRSCFIVDVNITDTLTTLTDSGRVQYYIDMTKPELVTQFKLWLKNIFLRAIGQRLTVFKYAKVGEAPDTYLYITKFMTVE